MKILLVEDDQYAAEALSEALMAHQYTVTSARDGQSAWELTETYEYDLILLDVVVPGMDGITLCRKLRSQGQQMPILLLTGKDGVGDRVLGLDAGADDYVIKPYDLEELIARVRALLRRGSTALPTILTWEQLQLDPRTNEVTYQDKILHLTPKEYKLLELFLRNPRRVFSRATLLDHVWSDGEFPGEDAVTTHIKGLRQKLKAAGLKANLLETVYGMGYRLNSPPDESAAAVKPDPTDSNSERQQAEARVRAVVARMWEQFQESLEQQIEGFEAAIASISKGKLDDALRQQVTADAHRLIGSLGTFGIPEGTQVCREMEAIFQQPHFKRTDAERLKELLRSLRRCIKQKNTEPVSTVSPSTDPTQARLLVVDNDTQLTAQLNSEAITWSIHVEAVASFEQVQSAIAQTPPDLILLNLTLTGNAQAGLKLLAELMGRSPTIPILLLGDSVQLSDRVEAANLGGQGFLQKPISPEQILQRVDQTLHPTQAKAAKILVVDDDPPLLAALQAMLKPWGFQVTTLADPQKFWDMLETTSPDLLILDIAMPEFSGIELCQVVRNDARWSGLPILFLSAHSDPNTLHRVFAAGADDYISKPVVGPELIARVLNRLERTQILRKLAEMGK